MNIELRSTRVKVALVVLTAAVLLGGLIRIGRTLATTRGAVAAYARLIASANVADLATIRTLCTDRFLAEHPLRGAERGGVVGFPRQIHPNYQVWVEGEEVWLCQGNRVGLVVRFRREAGVWKYDGEVGLLRPGGQVVKPGRDDSPDLAGKTLKID